MTRRSRLEDLPDERLDPDDELKDDIDEMGIGPDDDEASDDPDPEADFQGLNFLRLEWR